MRNTTEYPDRKASTQGYYQRNLVHWGRWCSGRRSCLLQGSHSWYHYWNHHGWWLYPVLLSLNSHKVSVVLFNMRYENRITGFWTESLVCVWLGLELLAKYIAENLKSWKRTVRNCMQVDGNLHEKQCLRKCGQFIVFHLCSTWVSTWDLAYSNFVIHLPLLDKEKWVVT